MMGVFCILFQTLFFTCQGARLITLNSTRAVVATPSILPRIFPTSPFRFPFETQKLCFIISRQHVMHGKARASTPAFSSCALYDGIYQMQKEQKRQYISKTQVSLIAPAVEEMERAFTQNDLTVCELAAMCGISEVYFRRLFLNTFGISPKEYIIQKRIEYAKTLLSSKDFSVGEVGILCGYTEPCHFSREFSKRVGISPMQYENL